MSDMGKNAQKGKMENAIRALEGLYAGHGTALRFNSVFQLAVAVMLSAQCTDVRVNIVTKGLFAKYKTAKDFAALSQKKLEKLIFSTGFYRSKAKNIREMAKTVGEKFGGKMPCTMEKLTSLQGIGRKSANVILSEGFGISEGIAVDTHVRRLSGRLGFSKSADPKKIETDLMELCPKEKWHFLSNSLIWHGRRTCHAQKRDCKGCALAKLCPSADTFSKWQYYR